ncbi:hypothetical protein [Flavobacterium johnsoniae]|uniref:Transporter n=1 Tax=Flavobacterium johnsoniae (strain ATCC 17061 / DSM 2064 / JCM 8514 / BCRC 14874 / CCUG 350202 / NBRC 14942 / NCIMB 11054 / UW101) TaxID=376686 RepID=A5FKT9_FLAJ1|nr:hypothetical protein [Flavobacterium johnsoniae]ABQ04177.1 hypothetical protein Fjoh_1144 [Flavobacterium johnsoniae UW101]OXG02589.1 hypothetical protein B0A63_02745 [Flavobacterium johnsoniae UW101]WQG84028.1 hypothetical protein SR927_13075 [Flavobacterium johnsoniae UW101]SHK14655.1 hypothetical protein SAMN05444146_0560 [Flavobacterium johnsoniae]
MKRITILFLSTAFFILSFNVCAQDAPPKTGASAQELADKLANPVASLISVPLQNNLTYGIGPYNGIKYQINIQPVVPFKLSENLNLITRYILPVVDQQDVTGANTHEFGLSDATITAFFAPKTKGIIFGAGPAFLVPTATEKLLGTEKFGIGPSVLVMHQGKGLSIGFLANQIWSVAGASDRADFNQFYTQIFLTHSYKSGASLGVSSEITQNWQGNTTLITLSPNVGAITKLGSQTMQFAVMPLIPIVGHQSIKPDWGLRAVVAFVFPGS